MNPAYPDEELAAVLARGGAALAVVLAPFYDRAKEVQPRTALRGVIVAVAAGQSGLAYEAASD